MNVVRGEVRSDRLRDLLTELSIDPFKRDALLGDPAGVMAAAGLSVSEQELLAHRIARAAGHAPAEQPVTRAALIFDPGDDPDPNPDPNPTPR